jgi:uncharacterized SAM-binding protein YcdF (DUF218 family)
VKWLRAGQVWNWQRSLTPAHCRHARGAMVAALTGYRRRIAVAPLVGGVWRRLRRRRVWIPLVVVGALLLGATARLFIWPSTDDPRRADAVVVLDGGSGERLDEARALMERHVAPTLAISAGREIDRDEADGLCTTPQQFEVVCFSPTPDSTRGEARALATLARQNGWNQVVLVTSTYHVTRAHLLVKRCFDGRVDVVAASPPARPLDWTAAVGHEWAAMLDATIRRTC